jgi:N-acetyl-anhydromuramyl-L-alanine amidase AmpD
VIHCTVSPLVPGAARAVAEWFRNEDARGSAHYVVDARETLQVVYDDRIAWHAPPNEGSIGVELCDALLSREWDRVNAGRWKDADHRRMLRRAARLVARLCLAYDVPIERLDGVDLRAGRRGITGHADVAAAWNQSTHWDPGPAFPWARFIRQVRRQARKIQQKESPS